MIRLVKPSGFGICGCVGIWRTGLEGSFPLGPVSCEVASSEQAGLGGSFVVEPVSCELAGSKQAGLVGSLCAGGAGGLLRIDGFCEFRNLRIQNCRIA
jgi:hypothetical protein